MNKMITIFRSFGLPEFQGKKVTKNLVLKLFDAPDKIILHNSFSYEMKYIKKGISFFYLKEIEIHIDEEKKKKRKKKKKRNQKKKN